MHVHVHVIPRYSGDVPDPRGGVRFVIPEKANYLKNSETDQSIQSAGKSSHTDGDLQLATGHPDSRLWDRLSTRMVGARLVDILASFVQLSGLDVIERRLFEVLRGEATVRILVSDYLYISDPRALARLLAWREAIMPAKETMYCCESQRWTVEYNGGDGACHGRSGGERLCDG